MLAIDLMSHPAVTVSANDSIAEAAAQLMRWQITTAPVIGHHGNLVGMVSTTDLIRAKFAGADVVGQRHGRRIAHCSKTTVADVMVSGSGSVNTMARAGEALKLLTDERIRCLPVLDGQTVVGVLSREDLLPGQQA